MTPDIEHMAQEVVALYKARGLRIAIAESCTGGLVCAALTSVPGSSQVLERGFVTYSNAAKVEMLGVDPSLINTHGAVSEAVARAMAKGALVHSRADVTVSITGIAGPDGGSEHKPVGLVHLALARDGYAVFHSEQRFPQTSRSDIRIKAIQHALGMLLQAVSL